MIVNKKIFLIGVLAISGRSFLCGQDAVVAQPAPETPSEPVQEAPPMVTPTEPLSPTAPAPQPEVSSVPAEPAGEQPVVVQTDPKVITAAEIEAMEPEPMALEPLEDDFEGENDEGVTEELAAVPDVQGGTRGNWYKKQQAVKRAHEEYQTVRKLEAQVVPYEQQVLNKKNGFQNKIEEFSQEVGFAMGQLDQSITEYLQYFDTQRPGDGVMSEAERLRLTDLNEKKRELEQLKKDFEAVKQSRGAIDQALAVMLQQLSLCHDYEQQAFEKYEKIAHVLSDQIAEQLYVEIKTLGENIQAVDAYLKGEFTVYFDTLLKKASEQIEVVQMSLRTLKEHGINLAVSPTAGSLALPVKTEAPVKISKTSWTAWLFNGVAMSVKRIVAWVLGWFH